MCYGTSRGNNGVAVALVWSAPHSQQPPMPPLTSLSVTPSATEPFPVWRRGMIDMDSSLAFCGEGQGLHHHYHNHHFLLSEPFATSMTILSDIRAAYEDEDLFDVALVGSDGVEVNANKTILAVRSTVFHRMFFGNFSERQNERVELAYPSVLLKILVRYTYTDELDLDLVFDNDDNDLSVLKDGEAVAMVQLRDAANYLELTKLHRVLTEEIWDSLSQEGGLSSICAVLNELYQRGNNSDLLYQILLDICKQVPDQCLFPQPGESNKGISACSLGVLEEMLGDLSSSISPFSKAKALQIWCQDHADSFTTDSENPDQQILHQLALTVDLQTIPPHKLSELKPCPLFSMQTLYEALVHATRQHPASAHDSSFKALVKGAGLECVNGIYTRGPSLSSGYTKKGFYGGVKSVFTIFLNFDEWSIVVAPVKVDPANGVQPIIFLYKAKPTGGGCSCPLTTWICQEGKGPAPYVALMPVPDFQRPVGQSPRDMVTLVYQKYNPSKLGEINSILAKYQGREEELFRKLAVRYNIDFSVFGLAPDGATHHPQAPTLDNQSNQAGFAPSPPTRRVIRATRPT